MRAYLPLLRRSTNGEDEDLPHSCVLDRHPMPWMGGLTEGTRFIRIRCPSGQNAGPRPIRIHAFLRVRARPLCASSPNIWSHSIAFSDTTCRTRSYSSARRACSRNRLRWRRSPRRRQLDRGRGSADSALRLSVYYEAARELARRLTEWSKKSGREERRFVVCTGGGPGIMEAANCGASEPKGVMSGSRSRVNVGLAISIAGEEFDNPYVSRELHFPLSLFLHAEVLGRLSRQGGRAFPGALKSAAVELLELTLLKSALWGEH
jgi:predicted Rossmann-fold nucleotide-binding protein